MIYVEWILYKKCIDFVLCFFLLLASYRKISCKDLGKGDCEGFLYRYLPKGTLSLVQWRLYWCVLKGGTLYVFKSKDDKNQEVEIKLEGKNVSPAPERRK